MFATRIFLPFSYSLVVNLHRRSCTNSYHYFSCFEIYTCRYFSMIASNTSRILSMCAVGYVPWHMICCISRLF